MSRRDLGETCPIKVDFHLHSAEDPADEIEHTAMELLHRAHALGFGAGGSISAERPSGYGGEAGSGFGAG